MLGAGAFAPALFYGRLMGIGPIGLISLMGANLNRPKKADFQVGFFRTVTLRGRNAPAHSRW